MTYPFKQGIDYGPRDGTLGLSFHMSEGYDGLPNYLARHSGEDLWEWADRVNGVSCNAALLSDGTIWQMLDWGHASGNLNPEDRAGEYGYYGHHHLRDVLGDHWPDPNAWTISMEIAGFRKNGPTDAQVKAAIAWGLDMRSRYPKIRGAVGHHDQSPKACPGLTANMKAIFAGVGGHGLFTEDDMVPYTGPDQEVGGTITTLRSTAAIPLNAKTGERLSVAAGITRPTLGVARLPELIDPATGKPGRPHYLMFVGPRLAWINATDVKFTPNAAAADCTDKVIAATAPLQSRISALKAKTAAYAADVAND